MRNTTKKQLTLHLTAILERLASGRLMEVGRSIEVSHKLALSFAAKSLYFEYKHATRQHYWSTMGRHLLLYFPSSYSLNKTKRLMAP